MLPQHLTHVFPDTADTNAAGTLPWAAAMRWT